MKTPITINVARQEVYLGRREIPLTKAEFNVLRALKTRNIVLTRDELLSVILDEEVEGLESRTVDQHVSRIRRKFKKPVIATVRSRGYKFVG